MTFRRRCAIIMKEQVELSRTVMPKGRGMRKVRASQGRITDNVRRGQPPGKCNRNRLPKRSAARYRWKGEVKAHRHDRQLCANVNPIRCNASTRGSFSGSCRPGRTAEAAERRLATTVTDRWQLRGSLRTEPGLQVRRRIPFRAVRVSRAVPERDFSFPRRIFGVRSS